MPSRIRASVHQYKQVALSIPRYFKELTRLRHPREFYAWAYFKCPNLFPLRKFPTYVSLEITNLCNLSCAHCWRASMDRPMGLMEFGLFEKIVCELALYRPSLVKIGGHGEPAIHPHFRDFMSFLSRHHLKVAVYTNGTLLRAFPHEEILSWGLDMIVVSVDGLDAETYEATKTGNKYAVLERDITNFYKRRQRSGTRSPLLDVRHVIMPNETSRELLKFRRKWMKTADMVKFNYLEPANGFTDTADPSPPRCRVIRRELRVNWDGTVPICGARMDDNLGNVRDSSIYDLWRDPRKEHLRRCNQRREFAQVPLCMRCVHCR